MPGRRSRISRAAVTTAATAGRVASRQIRSTGNVSGSRSRSNRRLRWAAGPKVTGQGALGKAVLSGKPAWISDIETDPGYSDSFRAGARTRGYRSLLGVPMLHDGAAIGAIVVTRATPGPFTGHQINLVKTFAGQAVIALENVRLFNETKDALERQTATAEILRVIASSPSNVQPVLDAIVHSAVRLFPPCDAVIVMREGKMLDRRARAGPTQIDADVLAKLFPAPYNPGNPHSPMSRCIETRSVVEVESTRLFFVQALHPLCE